MEHKPNKAMTIRMTRELWVFLKKKAIDHDTSINDLILSRLNKFKEKCENKLKKSDTVVS